MSKMTKQRKVLVAVLGVGVCAVVIDRMVLGGPKAANASEQVPGVIGEADGAALANETAPTVGDFDASASQPEMGPVDLSDFARRLEGVSVSTSGVLGRGDVFEPPADWQPSLEEEVDSEPDPEPESQIADGRLGRAFQASHTHDGRMEVGDIEYAIINGNRVSIGDRLDGFVLRAFNSYQSIWQAEATGEFVRLPETP
ncbi:MAG: hypothetical protein AAGA29_00660 [Planctomycetota bacterium]